MLLFIDSGGEEFWEMTQNRIKGKVFRDRGRVLTFYLKQKVLLNTST